MSSRPNLRPFPVILNQSMATSVNSEPSALTLVSYVSYTVTWSGSPVGILQVEACNDVGVDPNGAYIANTGTWVPIYMNVNGTSSNSIVVNGAGNAFIDIDGIAAAYIRLSYTATSGSGTLNAIVAGKVS